MKDRDKNMVRETAASHDKKNDLLTYDDYLRAPTGIRYELLEGDLRMVPSPSTRHQTVLGRLSRVLMEQLEDKGLGRVFVAPLDVVLSKYNVVQPDILFVHKNRLEIIGEANVQGTPDLVIEILSPSTEAWDRVTKKRLYSQYEVGEYWIVDPVARTIEIADRVYRVGHSISSALIPDLEVDLASLFAE